MRLFSIICITASLCAIQACQPDPSAQIAALEQYTGAALTPGKADSLIAAYEAAVKKNPADHATNFRHLLRGADLRLRLKQDPDGAGQWIETALDQHASGQNLGDAIGLYGRTWQQARQKPQFPAERLTAMRSRLEQNRVWLDSALVKLEKEMGAPIVTNPDKAREYIETADAYAAVVQGTDAEKSAALLMQAAGLAKTMDDAPKSLDLYTRLVSQFPKSKHAPTALFMTGFIYNEMGDLDKARAAYEQFIRNYPDNEMVLSAKMEIKNLGKSTDDILREFEQQQKQGTLR
jgi:tetratricopeptide (TPR) repeat protein